MASSIFNINLPPAVKRPLKQLPLFAPRNVAPRIAAKNRAAFLESVDIPNPYNSSTFVPRLLELEQSLGTVRSALVGLMTVSPNITLPDIIEGLEAFDRITAKAEKKLDGYWFWKLRRLYRAFAPKLIFAWRENDLHPGLLNFERNLGGEKNVVGDCVVGTALFTLLAQELGFAATAGTLSDKGHVFAYFYKENRFFDIHPRADFFGQGTVLRFSRFRSSRRHILGSAFLFVASLIIMKIRFGEAVRSEGKALETLELLASAEAINPWHDYISRYKYVCCEVLR